MFDFLFSPVGRAARADYWYWLVLPFGLVAAIILVAGPIILGWETTESFLYALLWIFFVSHTAISIKRLHDQSLSGWLSLALVLPFIGAVAFLIWPDTVDFQALESTSDNFRLILLLVFSAVFAPFAYVLGLIWFGMGKDGVNRYGQDPLYR